MGAVEIEALSPSRRQVRTVFVEIIEGDDAGFFSEAPLQLGRQPRLPRAAATNDGNELRNTFCSIQFLPHVLHLEDKSFALRSTIGLIDGRSIG